MYNYKKKEIDNKIITTLDSIYKSNDISLLLLNDVALILKLTLKEDNYNLKYNGKVRNILSYIRHEHKSLSKFIKNKTKYKLENQDKNTLALLQSST